jgi:hypothetical protein
MQEESNKSILGGTERGGDKKVDTIVSHSEGLFTALFPAVISL